MSIKDKLNNKKPLVCLTAYTAPMAAAADGYCDLLLVGDSVSMVLYGEASTQSADMAMMIRHGRAVVKASTRAVIVVDMPYGSYEHTPLDALQNAQALMDETGCDAVKLEGGEDKAATIKLLVDNDIPVMGHIGLLPQSVTQADGYKVQGRDAAAAAQLKKDAEALQAAGVFCMVIEAVPETLAAEITALVNVPTIGIGASAACDGQILVAEDMLGLTPAKPPKFVKQYAALHGEIEGAIAAYAAEVRARAFPTPNHVYASEKLKKAS